jgi:hypothetical protein
VGELWNKFQDNLSRHIKAEVYRAGYRQPGDIPEGMTFRAWCEALAEKGLKVDGKPFRLDDRPAMAWIYDQIPSTPDEAYKFILVIMKCTQVGFTVMEMLAVLYLGLKFGPCTVGSFLPDMNLTGIKSSERFIPMVRSVPSIYSQMVQESPDGRKTGEGNVMRRRIGPALFIFSWTTGRVTTESVPMDILSFDEVQEMTKEQLEKTQERLSASNIRFVLMGSTANWPDEDIHHWYKRGSQHQFHTECPHCGHQKPMDEYFPSCIKWFEEEGGVYRYVCEKCGGIIHDTQRGEWRPLNPAADPPLDPTVPLKDRPLRIRSIHFPQFLSPTISAYDIIDSYNNAEDMKNFYNRKLGKPFLDPSQVPVTMEHLNRCVAAGAAAGIAWKSRARDTYMGIDQMGNYNVVVIKERLSDGRQAVVHVEEVYSDDPFMRCSDLMLLYGVAVCVVEINPNYNDAKRFAGRHRGRVFICNSFGSLVEGMIAWGDGPRLDSSDRRTDEAERDRYTLRMDQYKCMQVSMSRFTSTPPLCLFPDPQGLVQEVIEKGIKQQAPVLPRAFTHFTKTALVAEKDPETNKFKRSVRKIGIDPHFSYANMLCDVAWARAHGTATIFIPQQSAEEVRKVNTIEQNMPGLPPEVIEQMRQKPVEGEVCGNCRNFDADKGWCKARDLIVKAPDPGCFLFDRDPYR